MKPVGIHHVNLMFDDIDAAREFYAGVMGFDEIERPDFGFPGLWFQMGAQQLHMQPGKAPDSFQHFALEVDDMDAALAHLKARGIEPSWGPLKRPDYARAEIRDPDGNPIELRQWLAKKPQQ